MSGDIHCPSCAAPVPLEAREVGQAVECHNCKLSFSLTAELISAAERTVFRPAPRRGGASLSPAKPSAPATKTAPGSRPSDTTRSFDTGRPMEPLKSPFAPGTPTPQRTVPKPQDRPQAETGGKPFWKSPLVWCGVGGLAAALVVTLLVSTLLILAVVNRPKVAVVESDEASRLSSSDPDVQLAALTDRMKLNSGETELPNETYSLVRNLLASPNPQVRLAAVDCLASSNLSPPNRPNFLQQLLILSNDKDGEVSKRTQAAIVVAIGSTDPTVSDSLKVNLPPLLPGLATLTAHADPQVRLWAMRTLAQLGPEVAKADAQPVQGPGFTGTSAGQLPVMAKNLVGTYLNGIPEERPLAAQALWNIDIEGTHTAKALSDKMGSTAESQLLAALKQGTADQRRFAAFALGSLAVGQNSSPMGGFGASSYNRPPDALVETLLDAVAGNDEPTIALGLHSLVKLDAKGNRTAAAARKNYANAAAATFSDVLNELESAAETSQSIVPAEVRLSAKLHLVRGLGQLGPDAAAAKRDLEALAAASGGELKADIDRALSQIRGDTPVDLLDGTVVDKSRGAALVEKLKDIDKGVRTSAAEELADLGYEAEQQLKALVQLALGKESGCREAASYVLNRVDPAATKSVGHLRASPDVTELNPGQPLQETLFALLKTEPETRRFISRAMAEQRHNPAETIPKLVELLRESDTDLRRDVFYTLSRYDQSGGQFFDLLQRAFGDQSHVRIAPSFKDRDAQVQACLANILTRLRQTNPKLDDFLVEAMANPDSDVQTFARNLLKRANPSLTDSKDAAAYRRFMALASAELERGQNAKAETILKSCPPHLRNFEWNFCNRQALAGKGSAMPPRGGNVDSGDAAVFPLDLPVVSFRPGAPIGQVHEVKFGPETGAATSNALVLLGDAPSLDSGLAAAGEDGKVVLWSLGHQRVLESFRADSVAPCSIEFDSSGSRLLTVGTKVELWQLPSAKSVLQYPLGKVAVVHGAAFSSSGGQVAFACGNHLRLWKVSGAGAVDPPTEPALAEVIDLAYGVDGVSFLAALKNGSLALWSTATAKPKSICQHGERIDAFAYSKDGRFVALAGQKYITLWTIAGAAIAKSSLTLKAGMGDYRALAFTPAGDRLVAGNAAGKLFVWDTADGEVLLTHQYGSSPIKSLAFDPGGKLLAIAAVKDQVDVLNGLPHAGASGSADSAFAGSGAPSGPRGGGAFGPGGFGAGPPTGPGGKSSGGSSGPGGPGMSGGAPKGGKAGADKPGADSQGPGGIFSGKGGKTRDAGAAPHGGPKGPSAPGDFPGVPGGGVPDFPGGGVPNFPGGGIPGIPGGGPPFGGIGSGFVPDEMEEPDEKTVERASKRTNDAFDQCDKDFNGIITRTEARGDVRSSFNRIDTDKSGDISNDELYEFYLGPPKKKKKKAGAAP